MKIDHLSIFALSLATLFLASCSSGPSPSILEDADSITLKQGSQTILRYNKSLQKAPIGIDPINERSGYIHPVFSPTGKIATGDFSEDHPHQHGLFMAWTNTTYRGQFVDFWNPKEKVGRVEFGETIETNESKDSVSFTVKHRHIAIVEGVEEPVLTETWTVAAHQTQGEHFLFDVKSAQQLVGDDPLILNEYRYGGMALRGSNEWTKIPANPDGTCDFLTSEGHERIDANHTKTRWVRMSGIIDGEPTSITVLNHPGNFRSPQTARIHPEMPYFVFSPMVEGPFSIQPGETYTSFYRYLVTANLPDPKWLNEQWQEFAESIDP